MKQENSCNFYSLTENEMMVKMETGERELTRAEVEDAGRREVGGGRGRVDRKDLQRDEMCCETEKRAAVIRFSPLVI